METSDMHEGLSEFVENQMEQVLLDSNFQENSYRIYSDYCKEIEEQEFFDNHEIPARRSSCASLIEPSSNMAQSDKSTHNSAVPLLSPELQLPKLGTKAVIDLKNNAESSQSLNPVEIRKGKSGMVITKPVESLSKRYNESEKSQSTHCVSSDAGEEAKIERRDSGVRRDVAVKSVLRAMKKFYGRVIETTTGYKKKTKSIERKHKALLRAVKGYVEESGLLDISQNMAFYMACFAYPNDMKKILLKAKGKFRNHKEEIIQGTYVINLIENVCTRFSVKIFRDMI